MDIENPKPYVPAPNEIEKAKKMEEDMLYKEMREKEPQNAYSFYTRPAEVREKREKEYTEEVFSGRYLSNHPEKKEEVREFLLKKLNESSDLFEDNRTFLNKNREGDLIGGPVDVSLLSEILRELSRTGDIRIDVSMLASYLGGLGKARRLTIKDEDYMPTKAPLELDKKRNKMIAKCPFQIS